MIFGCFRVYSDSIVILMRVLGFYILREFVSISGLNVFRSSTLVLEQGSGAWAEFPLLSHKGSNNKAKPCTLNL